MSLIDTLPFAGRDERVRRYLFPRRILKTFGQVTEAEALLREKPLQIGLNESDLTRLSNGPEGTEKAGILLDFGCELHGGLRLLNAMTDGGPARVRLRFGESVYEAMSEIG